MIAFLGSVITNVLNLILPDYENYETTIGLIFILPIVLREVGLAVWLLIKGRKIQAAHE